VRVAPGDSIFGQRAPAPDRRIAPSRGAAMIMIHGARPRDAVTLRDCLAATTSTADRHDERSQRALLASSLSLRHYEWQPAAPSQQPSSFGR
jgi:hypothetical protein